jgi:eukaryotic-like serine/threonine-protein kinase
MEHDRWERIKEVFEAALERAQAERSAFVAEACRGDNALRQQVESLLAGPRGAGRFMETPLIPRKVAVPARGDDAPPTFSPQQIIAGRFKVLRFMGKGGMGEVYEAEDLQLRERVALKTVRQGISSDPGTLARFIQEIHLARRVTHSNVCRIFDLERHVRAPDDPQGAGETLFLTMEFLEGETLAERMRRQGSITADEALPLIEQMCEGLAAAHDAGVIHRDFKPGNVMLVSSTRASGARTRAVVTDFGLARATLPPVLLDAETLSACVTGGQILGTPAYMAPEQLEGREITPAADIYALGLVIYEMATSHQPFANEEPLASIVKRVKQPPPSPRVYVPDIDPRWESTILRCLEIDPAQRFASARDVVTALAIQPDGPRSVTPSRPSSGMQRRVVAGSLGAVLTLVVLTALFFHFNSGLWQRLFGPPLPDQKDLVVLPFRAIGGGQDEQNRCDGFTETVTSKLVQASSLQVVPAIEVLKKHIADVDQARTQLGANLVLSASWEHRDKLARINLALIKTSNHQQLRAETITEPADNSFALQDEVVETALKMLHAQLSTEAATTHGTKVLSAYDFYVQGVGYLQRYERPGNVDSAITLFQRAIKEDHNYAQAQAALARAYWYKYNATRERQWADQAKAAVKAAESLDSRLPEVQLAIGNQYQLTGAYSEALSAFRRGLELDPENVEAYQHLGEVYNALGRTTEAEQALRRAIEIRPACWSCYNRLGSFFSKHARFDDAAQAWQKVIDLAPDNVWGYMNVGNAYLYVGEFELAGDYYRRGFKVAPDEAGLYSNAGTVSFFLGRFEEDARLLEKAVELRPQKYDYWGNLADAYRMIPAESSKATKTYWQAIRLAKEQLEVNPKDSEALSYLALYYARVGEPAQGRTYLAKALEVSPDDWDILRIACLVHLEAGDRQEALKWLGQSVRAGYPRGMLVDDAELAGLRSDPEFARLSNEAKTYR